MSYLNINLSKKKIWASKVGIFLNLKKYIFLSSKWIKISEKLESRKNTFIKINCFDLIFFFKMDTNFRKLDSEALTRYTREPVGLSINPKLSQVWGRNPPPP